MGKACWLTILLIALSGSGPARAHAEPSLVDLEVSGIVPSATEPPKILVLVTNRGTQALHRSFNVELWLDDRLLGRRRIEENLLPETAGRDRGPVYVTFLRPLDLPEGFYTFTAKVDPEHTVREATTANNERQLTVWSKGPGARPIQPFERGRGR